MKKLLAALLSILLLMTLFSAAMAEDVITINWMIENRSEGEMEGFRKYLIEPFEEANPNIKVNVQPTADTMNVLRVQLSASKGPDLCSLDGPSAAAELYKAGRLYDLTKYAQEYGWNDVLADWAEATVTDNGTMFAIPAEVEALWLWYNPDLFNELGIKVPTTLEELKEACQKSMDNGYIAMAFGNGSRVTTVDWWLSAAYNMYAGSADVRAALHGEKKWTDDTLKGSIQMLNDIWQAGYINDRQSYAISHYDARAIFYTGMSTMNMEGSWYYGTLLSEATVNFDVTRIPTFRDGIENALPMGLGEAYAINAACSPEKADACAKLLDFMLKSTDLHIKQVSEYGLNPLPVDLPAEQFPADADPRLMRMISALNEAQADLNNSGLVVWTFWPAELRLWQCDNIDKVFLGQMTVDEFCAGSQEVFEKCLADGTVPAIP